MRRTINFFFIFLLALTLSTCKRKTSIHVKLFNPALNEYVANANIVLVDKKGYNNDGKYAGSNDCAVIANAITDNNGECFFDRERLKSNKKHNYFVAVKESWGLEQFYPCGGSELSYIDIGNTNDKLLVDMQSADVTIHYNNLLNPSQQNDSLIVSLVTIEYTNPDGDIFPGNEVALGTIYFYGSNGFPFPSTFAAPSVKIKSQRLRRTIRKRKMGIVTTTIDTIKVYPNQTTIMPINW
ncbi:MAG: hypothetical protein ABIP51_06745 [Bacteroidia bacterium]